MTPPEDPPPLPTPDHPPDPPADEVVELVPEPEPPVVRPFRRPRRPEPPQPGFLLSIAWCLGLLASLYIPLGVATLVTFAVFAVASGDPEGFFQGEWRQFRLVAGQTAGEDPDPEVPAGMPEGLSYSLAVGMAAGHLGSLTFTLLLLRFGVGRDWARKIALRRPPLVPLALSLLVLPGFMLVHSAVHLGLGELAGGDDGGTSEQLRAMLTPWPLWVAVLLIGVGPGVVEELFCRGYLGRGLVARYGMLWGVVLTSVLFGMLHLAPLYALGTMVMGLLLHVTYLATRSLWVPILLHFLNNTLTVLAILGVSTVPGLEADPTDLPAAAYLLGFALTGVGLWALWSARGRLDPADAKADEPAAWRQQFPGVELPPEGSGVRVRHRFPNPVAAVLTVAGFAAVWYFMS
jgi:membrane protease YdiL (CAAX protease family)